MYIQLIHDTCKHINANINQNNSMEVDNGLKLLEAIPRMVLANMHKHRGGKKGQGNASFTKTVRQRIDLIYKSNGTNFYPNLTWDPNEQRPTNDSTNYSNETNRMSKTSYNISRTMSSTKRYGYSTALRN